MIFYQDIKKGGGESKHVGLLSSNTIVFCFLFLKRVEIQAGPKSWESNLPCHLVLILVCRSNVSDDPSVVH